jgi:hypothetical protein
MDASTFYLECYSFEENACDNSEDDLNIRRTYLNFPALETGSELKDPSKHF